jgi:hypothetical protein
MRVILDEGMRVKSFLIESYQRSAVSVQPETKADC